MAQQLFLDELMERIRSQVRLEARSSSPFAGAGVLAKDEPSASNQILYKLSHLEPETAAAARVPRELPEFTGVRVELESCITALEKFGEVNPRHPGFVNDRIQNVKGVMRRTLVWYTRPLRLFHAAMIRTLQQLLAVAEKQHAMLGETAQSSDVLALERRLEDVELGICQTYEQAEMASLSGESRAQQTEVELQALRENVRELQAQIVALRQQLKRG